MLFNSMDSVTIIPLIYLTVLYRLQARRISRMYCGNESRLSFLTIDRIFVTHFPQTEEKYWNSPVAGKPLPIKFKVDYIHSSRINLPFFRHLIRISPRNCSESSDEDGSYSQCNASIADCFCFQQRELCTETLQRILDIFHFRRNARKHRRKEGMGAWCRYCG